MRVLAEQSIASIWLDHTQVGPSGRPRLFCMPYAGGSASIYRGWHGGVLNEFEVCPVQLPGRERRISEAPFDRILPLARTLVEVLPQNRPFALFGHSMGALLAFQFTRELRRQGRLGPTHLFVSGAPAPQYSPNRPPRFRFSRAQLIAELRKLGGTPKELLDETELLDLVLPALRADFEMIDTYQYVAEPPLDCPITAFAGDGDAEVAVIEMMDWRVQTRHRFNLRQFAGDHFFLNPHGNELRTLIAEHLQSGAR